MYKMKTIFVILLFAVFSVKCYADNSETVSYTHLTLPTICSV